MKLESIAIRNFRSIENLELSLKDDLDLIRDCVPVVGPNTSGKTTILDAIALSLMPVTELYQLREGLHLSPTSLVRSGAVRAEVSSTVWFSDDEIEATQEVMDRAGDPFGIRRSNLPFPTENHATVHWTFPDPQGKCRTGSYHCDPALSFLLFRGRKVLVGNLHVPGLGSGLFRRLGSIVMFDQQRTGLSKRLPSYERALLGQLLNLEQLGDYEGEDGHGSVDAGIIQRSEPVQFVHTTNPRLILTSLAMRAQVAQDPEATEKEDFARLKLLYGRVCHPHTMGELYNTEHGLDMEFWGENGRYYYDGLSSGQQMILLMLVQFATRRIHRSIVLTDELELHLHPLWQDRLYASLTSLGDDNQHIFTTHSTHLRDTIREQFYYATGELSNPAAAR
jgi:energy-coupling factor transporter ATP-binding protein EcfA2